MRLMPWPPHEPEPKPGEDSLYEDVDWLTYSHDQLYDMVHQGVDVGAATAVAARWAKLGDSLQEIADELARALAASSEAWHGEAADMARGTITALSSWAADTSVTATDVAGCVSIEANAAETARRSMPEPPPGVRVPTPIPVHPVHGTSPMSALSSARDLMKDPSGPTIQQRAAHEEAARVMERFQNASQEVYGTVPQFAPPALEHPLRLQEAPPVPPPAPPPPGPAPVVEPVPRPSGGGGGGGSVERPVAPRPGPVAPPGPAVEPAPVAEQPKPGQPAATRPARAGGASNRRR